MSEIEVNNIEKKMILPIGVDDFSNFIKSVLGKQQTITKNIPGRFTLNIDHILDIIDLLDQRITQQNKSTLIQTSLKIVFSDNSTRLLNSITEISTFSDPRDVYPISAHLSLEYLIQFQDKEIPEKQDISISFICGDIKNKHLTTIIDSNDVFIRHDQGSVFLSIKYTAVTWAYDIEALITKKIKSLLDDESKIANLLTNHSGKFTLAIASSLFIFIIGINVIGLLNYSKTKIKELADANLLNIDDKIDYLLHFQTSGGWTTQAVFSTIYIIVSLIISIFIAIWIEDSLDFRKPSYLLFNDEAQKNINRNNHNIKKKVLSFVGSIIISIAVGIASNIFVHFIMR